MPQFTYVLSCSHIEMPSHCSLMQGYMVGARLPKFFTVVPNVCRRLR